MFKNIIAVAIVAAFSSAAFAEAPPAAAAKPVEAAKAVATTPAPAAAPVTAEAAKAYSRLHPRCGTTFLLFVLSISIFLHTVTVPLMLLVWQPGNVVLKHATVIFFKLLLMAPISAMAYEAIRAAARMGDGFFGTITKGPGLLLQMLTTQEPDTAQLEVALVALKEALKNDSQAIITTPEYTLTEQS